MELCHTLFFFIIFIHRITRSYRMKKTMNKSDEEKL